MYNLDNPFTIHDILRIYVYLTGIGHYGGGRYGGGRYGGRRYGGGHYGGNLPKGGHYGGKERVTHIRYTAI